MERLRLEALPHLPRAARFGLEDAKEPHRHDEEQDEQEMEDADLVPDVSDDIDLAVDEEGEVRRVRGSREEARRQAVQARGLFRAIHEVVLICAMFRAVVHHRRGVDKASEVEEEEEEEGADEREEPRLDVKRGERDAEALLLRHRDLQRWDEGV